MNAAERRAEILRILSTTSKPMAGGVLAKELKVSRQIVVGDIALMRAGGEDIIATNDGYLLNRPDSDLNVVTIRLKHKTEDLFDVLCTIIDEGAEIKSLYIDHSIYGRVFIPFKITNRAEARGVSEAFMESGEKVIGDITGFKQYYEIGAGNQLILLRVQKNLNDKGYLIK